MQASQTHEMEISRVGFWGAIAAYCSCGWISKQMTGSKQLARASKAFSIHCVKEKMNS